MRTYKAVCFFVDCDGTEHHPDEMLTFDIEEEHDQRKLGGLLELGALQLLSDDSWNSWNVRPRHYENAR